MAALVYGIGHALPDSRDAVGVIRELVLLGWSTKIVEVDTDHQILHLCRQTGDDVTVQSAPLGAWTGQPDVWRLDMSAGHHSEILESVRLFLPNSDLDLEYFSMNNTEFQISPVSWAQEQIDLFRQECLAQQKPDQEYLAKLEAYSRFFEFAHKNHFIVTVLPGQ